jgi:hypothetical protein
MKENQINAQHDTNYNGAKKLNFLKSPDISKHRFIQLATQNLEVVKRLTFFT